LRANDEKSFAVETVFINGTTFTKHPSWRKPIDARISGFASFLSLV